MEIIFKNLCVIKLYYKILGYNKIMIPKIFPNIVGNFKRFSKYNFQKHNTF